MSKSLRDKPLDVLVLQSGRQLEQLARELVPDERDADGKPLMLGARIYTLRDRLDEETWTAFHAWSTARNAYVHGSADDVGDREAFESHYALIYDALTELAEPEEDVEAEGLVGPILIVVLVVGLALVAC